jgi:anti-sigma factor RsiW
MTGRYGRRRKLRLLRRRSAKPPSPRHPAPDERLSAYLDGELDDAERHAIESYVQTLPEWRAELDEVAWARDALRRLPVHEAPPGFWEAALAPELT